MKSSEGLIQLQPPTPQPLNSPTLPSSWVRYRSAAYLRGRGLHVGLGTDCVWPAKAKRPGGWCVGVSPDPRSAGDVCEEGLGIFHDGAFEWVFVGGLVEAMPNPSATIKEAASKLQVGGHLLVHLPLLSTSRLNPSALPRVVRDCGGWRVKAQYERHGQILHIYKKLSNRAGEMRGVKAVQERRACVVRYGAFGDMVMVTPLLRALAADGYHTVVNCTSYSASVLDYNPHVGNLAVQEKDVIPNQELGAYWAEWEGDYQKYINLSESVEGKFLVVEKRPAFYTPQSYRIARGDHNYYEATLEVGGYAGADPHPELFFSGKEERWAKKFVEAYHPSHFIGMWSLSGSSFHKIYGLLEPVLTTWLDTHPDAVFVLVGGPDARRLEFDHPQIAACCGQIHIRDAMCLTKYVDVVVGPETGILNAASCYNTPKVLLLSHSTPNALSKHWSNTINLCPDPAIAPCYPCFQLHYNRDSCPQVDVVDEGSGEVLVSGPKCAMGAIQGERVIAALNQVYEQWKSAPSSITP